MIAKSIGQGLGKAMQGIKKASPSRPGALFNAYQNAKSQKPTRPQQFPKTSKPKMPLQTYLKGKKKKSTLKFGSPEWRAKYARGEKKVPVMMKKGKKYKMACKKNHKHTKACMK